MSPSATKRHGKAFRYYVCGNAAKTGWQNCPHPSLSAQQIENAVVERIKVIGRDPGLLKETLTQIRSIKATRQPSLVAERRRLEREVVRLQERGQDADVGHVERLEARLLELVEELAVLSTRSIDKRDLAQALSMFDEVWACLYPREQQRILELLIERVDFDAERESVAVTFRPTGIRSLAGEISGDKEGVA